MVNQDFKYRVKENEVIIEKYRGESTQLEVPKMVEGLPVTEIADYAFHNCRGLQKVILPDSITTIGNHAFYDCRGLESLVASDAVRVIGDGAFKNCDLLNSIELYQRNGKISALRSILSEFSRELTVTLYYGEDADELGKTAKLVFPKFQLNYVENDPARIITQETFGSGVHYRECMTDTDIDYKKYDSVFRVGVAVDLLETTLFTALYRIMYPYQLMETAKEIYETFLTEQWEVLLKVLVEEEGRKEIRFLLENQIFTEDHLDALMEYARKQEKLELVSYFLSFKQKYYRKTSFDFEL